MFIAVESYKNKVDNDNNMFLIFDTNDCTVGVVDLCVIRDFDIKIENIYMSYNGRQTVDMSSLYTFLNQNSNEEDFVHVAKNNHLMVGGMDIDIDFMVTGVLVNNVLSLDREQYVLGYLFLYKDYVILRMLQRFSPNKWYTFAVKDETGEVEQWSEDLRICTNKSLAMQVDMTLEV